MIWPDGIALSSRRRLPTLRLGGFNYPPWTYLSLALKWKGWSVKTEGGIVRLESDGTSLLMSPFYAYTMLNEWDTWRRDYLPPFSLRGKTVLDAGAGCGEATFFFLRHGAAKVFSVELNKEAFRLLSQNITNNSWNAEAVNEALSDRHLQAQNYDFVKIDVEGGEAVLLSLDKLPDYTVIETHGRDMTEAFMSKFKMNVAEKLSGGEVCILRSWGKLSP